MSTFISLLVSFIIHIIRPCYIVAVPTVNLLLICIFFLFSRGYSHCNVPWFTALHAFVFISINLSYDSVKWEKRIKIQKPINQLSLYINFAIANIFIPSTGFVFVYNYICFQDIVCTLNSFLEKKQILNRFLLTSWSSLVNRPYLSVWITYSNWMYI